MKLAVKWKKEIGVCTNDTSSPHGGDIMEFKGISPKIADNCFVQIVQNYRGC